MYKNIVYFTNWSAYNGRNYNASMLPFSSITHIHYAFMNLDQNGKVFSGDTWSDYGGEIVSGGAVGGYFQQFNTIKKNNRNVKLILSIGGWTWSKHFSEAISNPALLKSTATNMVNMIKDLGCDGIDLDWEYPGTEAGLAGNSWSVNDGKNLLSLLQAIRSGFNALNDNNSYSISLACTADPVKADLLPWRDMIPLLDYINVMCYDFEGADWSGKILSQSNLYPNPATCNFSGDRAMAYYKKVGFPSQKLVMGIPLYSRSWAADKPITGLGADFSGTPSGGTDGSGNGMIDYNQLPPPGFTETYDPIGVCAYALKGNIFHSYDNLQSLSVKVDYIKKNNYGGSMFWEASNDYKDAKRSLVQNAARLYGTMLEKKNNNIYFPNSVYTNIWTSTKNPATGPQGNSSNPVVVPSGSQGTQGTQGTQGPQTPSTNNDPVITPSGPQGGNTTPTDIVATSTNVISVPAGLVKIPIKSFPSTFTENGIQCIIKKVSSWTNSNQKETQYSFTIKNTGKNTVRGVKILCNGSVPSSFSVWNCTISTTQNQFFFTFPDWMNEFNPGNTLEMGGIFRPDISFEVQTIKTEL